MMLFDSPEEVISLINGWHDMTEFATPLKITAALSFLLAEHLVGVLPRDREARRKLFNEFVDDHIPRIDEAVNRIARHLLKRARQ
jgi:hypothetical protein